MYKGKEYIYLTKVAKELIAHGAWIWAGWGSQNKANPKAPVELKLDVALLDEDLKNILYQIKQSAFKDNYVKISWGMYYKLRNSYNNPPDVILKAIFEYLQKGGLLGFISGLNGWVMYDIDYYEYMDIFAECFKTVFGKELLSSAYVEKSMKGFHVLFKVIDCEDKIINGKLIFSMDKGKNSTKEVKRCGTQFVVIAPSPYWREGKIVGKYEVISEIKEFKDTIKAKYEQLLKFEELLAKKLVEKYGDSEKLNNYIPKEQKSSSHVKENIDCVPAKPTPKTIEISLSDDDRVDIPAELVERVARKLYSSIYWAEGWRWFWTITISAFLFRFTKLNLNSVVKIIEKLCQLGNTDEKRTKELLVKVRSVYSRLYVAVGYWTLAKREGLLTNQTVEILAKALQKTMHIIKTDLKAYCTLKELQKEDEVVKKYKIDDKTLRRLKFLQYQYQKGHSAEDLLRSLGIDYNKYAYRHYFHDLCCLYENKVGLWNVVDDEKGLVVFAFLYFYIFEKEKFEEFLKKEGLWAFIKAKTELPAIEALKEFWGLEVVEKIQLEGQYLTEEVIKHIIEENNHKFVGLKAKTGAGKTTALINYAKKYNRKMVLLVPYSSQARQLGLKHDIDYWCEGSNRKKTDSIVIVGTYDQLLNIIEELKSSGWDLKDVILVIDEYHNLSLQKFRFSNIRPVFFGMPQFRKVVFCSGTFEGVNVENAPIFEVETVGNKPITPYHIIKVKGDILNAIVNDVIKKQPKKAVFFLNSKEKLAELRERLQKLFPNHYIEVLTSEQKTDSIIYKNIVEKEIIYDLNDEKGKLKGFEGVFLLTTSVLADGVNILDRDIETVYIAHVEDYQQLRQFLARFRNGVGEYRHYVNASMEVKLSTIMEKLPRYTEFFEINTDEAQSIVKTLNERFKDKKQSGLEDIDYYALRITEQEYFVDWDVIHHEYKLNRYRINAKYWEKVNFYLFRNSKALAWSLDFLEGDWLNISIKETAGGKKLQKEKLSDDDKLKLAIWVSNTESEKIEKVLEKRTIEGVLETQKMDVELAELVLEHKEYVKTLVERKKAVERYDLDIETALKIASKMLHNSKKANEKIEKIKKVIQQIETQKSVLDNYAYYNDSVDDYQIDNENDDDWSIVTIIHTRNGVKVLDNSENYMQKLEKIKSQAVKEFEENEAESSKKLTEEEKKKLELLLSVSLMSNRQLGVYNVAESLLLLLSRIKQGVVVLSNVGGLKGLNANVIWRIIDYIHNKPEKIALKQTNKGNIVISLEKLQKLIMREIGVFYKLETYKKLLMRLCVCLKKETTDTYNSETAVKVRGLREEIVNIISKKTEIEKVLEYIKERGEVYIWELEDFVSEWRDNVEEFLEKCLEKLSRWGEILVTGARILAL